MEIRNLRLNGEKEGLAFAHMPAIGWELSGTKRNIRQSAYEIQLAPADDTDFAAPVWATERTLSDDSQNIQLAAQLEPDQRYRLRVRAWTDAAPEPTDWSEPVCFRAGLRGADWRGKFITPENPPRPYEASAYYLRCSFNVREDVPVSDAVLYMTALGVYRPFLNGRRVGDLELAPGWTAYQSHLRYQVYELTDNLQPGENVLGALLGVGWYKGTIGQGRCNYGQRAVLLAQLSITYADGQQEIICTDTDWQGALSPISFAEIYDGEIYDARLEEEHWAEPDFEPLAERGWQAVSIASEVPAEYYEALRPTEASPVRAQEILPALKVFETPAGETVVDFGQNLAGWTEVQMTGDEGDYLELQCFEVLDEQGNVYTENLGSAKQTLVYVFARPGKVSFVPHFTFQGFRYAQLLHFPEGSRPKAADFRSHAVYSSMERTGTFHSSSPLLNRFMENVTWSMRSNFLDVPTDCPQRSERLGWLGDAQIFAPTACYLYNVAAFFRKWLHDLACDQREDGGLPHVVPDVLSYSRWGLTEPNRTHSASGWADAAVLCPWAIYLAYGDRELLERQYPSMRAWVEYMHSQADEDGIWNYGTMQFGDWVALDAPANSRVGATPLGLIGLAGFARSTEILAKTAALLGKEKDAACYRRLHGKLCENFRRLYLTKDGQLSEEAQTQTSHVLALAFDLLPEAARQTVADRLAEMIREAGGHLLTGFLGTPHLCTVLARHNHLDLAYELLFREESPSWLFEVKQGATTIWERWDGIKADGSLHEPGMNSFNHYAYGAVAAWVFSALGGLSPDEQKPGYKHSHIRPLILEQYLTHAETRLQTYYGELSTDWNAAGGLVEMKVTIPPNTTADIELTQAVEILAADGLDFRPALSGWQASAGSGTYNLRWRQG